MSPLCVNSVRFCADVPSRVVARLAPWFRSPGSAYRTADTMKFCKLRLFPANRPGYMSGHRFTAPHSPAMPSTDRQASAVGGGFLARLSLDRDFSRCVKSWPVSAQSAVSVASLRPSSLPAVVTGLVVVTCNRCARKSVCRSRTRTICGRKQEQRTQRSLWRKATPRGLRASSIPAKVSSILSVCVL